MYLTIATSWFTVAFKHAFIAILIKGLIFELFLASPAMIFYNKFKFPKSFFLFEVSKSSGRCITDADFGFISVTVISVQSISVVHRDLLSKRGYIRCWSNWYWFIYFSLVWAGSTWTTTSKEKKNPWIGYLIEYSFRTL